MTQPTQKPKTPLPERGFGITFGVVFAILALAPKLLDPASAIHWWAIGISAVFLILAFGWPVTLKPLRRLWLRFGMLLHSVMTHLVINALFFLVITPIALILRTLGKASLNLRKDPDAQSYWVTRQPPGPSAERMKDQF